MGEASWGDLGGRRPWVASKGTPRGTGPYAVFQEKKGKSAGKRNKQKRGYFTVSVWGQNKPGESPVLKRKGKREAKKRSLKLGSEKMHVWGTQH